MAQSNSNGNSIVRLSRSVGRASGDAGDELVSQLSTAGTPVDRIEYLKRSLISKFNDDSLHYLLEKKVRLGQGQMPTLLEFNDFAVNYEGNRDLKRSVAEKDHELTIKSIRMEDLNHTNALLTTANNNLTATNNNLTATNNTLTATNNTLTATNNTLTATNNTLTATNNNLTATVANLSIENANLREEMLRLRRNH